jgi:probable F420-dependent oxidoreductase
MKFGVVFPQIEFPPDPVAARDYAQAVEGLGYSHLLAYDHVLGANPDRPGGWTGPYVYEDPFLEPLVFFSYLAGLTSTLGFVTGVIILPQRQAVLAAKQAATLDVLCGGRLRLGVGLGWNRVEYQALGEDFSTRGRRLAEQVEVMRLLWTRPLVDFQGREHSIEAAGLNPLPVQKPIPIWFGGTAEAALKRMARLGDGWLVNTPRPADAKPMLEIITTELERLGRPAGEFGLEARVHYKDGDIDLLRRTSREWQSLGMTYISVNTMNSKFTTPQQHLQALERFAREVGTQWD